MNETNETTEVVTTPNGTQPLLWWTYNQNNSGGSFQGPQYVFVQARNAKEADFLAEQSGLVYFDDSQDCACCGSRWTSADSYGYAEDGYPTPSYCGQPVDWRDPKANSRWGRWPGEQSARVLFDGSVELGVTHGSEN